MERPAFAPSYRGFCAFCRAVGYPLARFQRRIARAALGDDTEVVACLPRGQAKSTLAALLALHHCLSRPEPSVYIGASARIQARVIGQIIERYARHPAISDRLTVRLDEVRLGDRHGPTALLIVSADGARAHGWERPSLMIGDETWAWSDRPPTLLGAMQTALVKSSGARLLLISTAPASDDSPLGRIRARALAQTVWRDGAYIDARGGGLHWLEWSLEDGADPSDIRAVKRANPAPWITAAQLAAQRERVGELEWLQYHCNRAGSVSARWLPPGAWAACRADYEVADDEPWTIGVDVGGTRSATACVACVGDENGVRVADVRVWQGRAAVLEVSRYVEHLLAEGRRIHELVFDPMRFEGEAQRLERAHRLTLVEWPQTATRMARCSEHLHGLVIEQRLRHPGHPALDKHVANAIAVPVHGHRAWRLSKSADAAQIDALIALSMAAERASQPRRTPQLVGWL